MSFPISRVAVPAGVALLLAVAAAGYALARRSPEPPPAPSWAKSVETSRRESIRSFWDAFRRGEAARLSGRAERLGEAEAGYREALAIDPDHEDALWELANVLDLEGRRGEAVELLRRHVVAHPGSTRGFARLGDLLSGPDASGSADVAEAEAMYRHALSLNPEESGDYVNLGRLLYRKGELREAEAQFRSALKINFKSLVAARFLALIALRRGDTPGAARQLVTTLEKNLSDKPRLFAFSEGDVRESADAGKLTPMAREIFPAAEFLWLLTRVGSIPEGSLPDTVRHLMTSPLALAAPGGKPLIRTPTEGTLADRRVQPRPGSGQSRSVVADFDGDGIGDRFTAGPTEAAESAAWILTGEIFCGDRGARFEKGRGDGTFHPETFARLPPACLPSGRISTADVNGDGVPDLIDEASDADPIRMEPSVLLLSGAGSWSISPAPPRISK